MLGWGGGWKTGRAVSAWEWLTLSFVVQARGDGFLVVRRSSRDGSLEDWMAVVLME